MTHTVVSDSRLYSCGARSEVMADAEMRSTSHLTLCRDTVLDVRTDHGQGWQAAGPPPRAVCVDEGYKKT